MKRITLLAALLVCIGATGQKKPLDHSVYDGWKSVSKIDVSNTGKYISYVISEQEGDTELHIETADGNRKISVPRGGNATFTSDENWAYFTIKAPFADTRLAKIKKKKAEEMPKDSIGYVDLASMTLYKIADASGAKNSFSGNSFAYQVGEKEKKSLIRWQFGTEKRDSIKNASSYAFSDDGKKFAVVLKKDKKDSLSRDAVILFNGNAIDTLSKDLGYYSLPTFNASSDKLVFLASADTNKTGSKHCSIMFYDLVTKKMETLAERQLTENAGPYFSAESNRVIFGLADFIPENDTTLVEFETPQLDIWNYDIYMTPPFQKANASTIEKATSKAMIDLRGDHSKIIRIAQDIEENTYFFNGAEGDYAMVLDDKAYQISSTWDSNDLCDVYLVDLNDGARRNIFKSLDGRATLSPAGKYICWYTDKDWYTYRISDGKITNITKGVKGTFYDDEDDHPMPKPYIDSPHWLENDEAFVMADKYDLFYFTPDGKKAKNLTTSGAKKNIEYRFSNISKNILSPALSQAGIRKCIKPTDEITMTTFDRTTKQNGYASYSLESGKLTYSFTEPRMYNGVTSNKGTIIMTKGSYREPFNVYVSSDNFATTRKLTTLEEQMEPYFWGNIQLVKWNAYDGTPLEGLLITPEGLDPSKKYPMIVYFYETYSEELFAFRSPAPSRSTINMSYFPSNGYVVFIPDIKYKDGHPGECAYNCVCSGAEAMCEQFPFINKDKMGIQGQSWGGYQTAYLVTRTNMFAAAGAGAPVGNMTSAYGGIRWESGMVRAMQYEHGQSRIGTSLWDEGGLDLYIENSPIFHVQNVTTPTLIMHNDNDGAVPWYQGIEFFMALRRFHHPAWLLEYNNESHNLSQRKNAKDLSIRLQQFFDHYLKDAPMPAWMKTGVPTSRKAQYFGYELVED